MPVSLEDELGDVLEKARDGKGWSQSDLARASGVSANDISQIERYEHVPDDDILKHLAEVLDLHVASFLAVAKGAWLPKPIEPEPSPYKIVCLELFVGTYPVKCYFVICKATNACAVIDTGGNPEVIIEKAKELNIRPEKILLTHAHHDHAGGINALQRISGAAVYTSDAGQKVLMSGELQDDDPQYLRYSDASGIPAVKNVVAIGDREVVSIGTVDVMAVYTPGHTPGGITWVWESCALRGCYDTVYADSLSAVSAEGYYFSDGPAANQLIESAGVIADLDCDILLSPHPFFFGMQAKLEKRDEGNPFVNNVACMIYAETALDWLEQRLQSEGG